MKDRHYLKPKLHIVNVESNEKSTLETEKVLFIYIYIPREHIFITFLRTNCMLTDSNTAFKNKLISSNSTLIK